MLSVGQTMVLMDDMQLKISFIKGKHPHTSSSKRTVSSSLFMLMEEGSKRFKK